MAFILTFLGKGGTGRTTIAIAAAKQLSSLGQRVLLVGQDPSPAFGLLLGATPSSEPQEVGANLKAVQLQSTLLLERSWEEVKKLEAQYLRSPTLKNVFGQELGVLPGMDTALALNAIREYDSSGNYDTIIYDGSGDQATLRMLGLPEIFSWYIRRFRQVFTESDLGKAISPFVQPVTSAILNVTWTPDDFAQQPTKQTNQILDQGRSAVADPNRVAAYVVTTGDTAALATAKYLWGSAQQVNLTVGGVLLNQIPATETLAAEFDPLTVSALPQLSSTDDWQPLIDALPDFKQAAQAPKPIIIDTSSRQVRLFLPGFDKKQVKLTQYGPEVTIEAGDQRRNIILPPQLSGQPVKGAKFQDRYLTISF
ncbi:MULTISPECIES: ArsA family ATPase [unclassified Coleofasciculus]|uniref:Get3/ArsA fold putative tail anchor-mediating ATPase NosAFP n=1 Tax=unclassified Coleofasciculus TaxID=2692782 RepID=UPI00187E702A|nr:MULTISPECIES: ArsA family ATPase [unclassified Coleofasciculus]MBE9125272.1 ArsA family ATPase [Coleofasciculus sp. LEGE 07081]MBE9147053.1 ArsA family ATPase [Coleofasciculus sp. LEGE 07092]